MARQLPPKTVVCYHCHHAFEVGGRTQSTSCPGCNKPVMVADQIIDRQRGPLRELRTCGQVIVKKKGRLICHHIVAHAGIDCIGIIDAKDVVTGRHVHLGPKSQFKGDLTAPSLSVDLGARITASAFRIGLAPEDDEPG